MQQPVCNLLTSTSSISWLSPRKLGWKPTESSTSTLVEKPGIGKISVKKR